MEHTELVELTKRLIHPAVFETIREPLLVLDPRLEVVAANRSFYEGFDESPDDVIARPIFSLGNGQWEIPSLRELLEKVLPREDEFNGFQVDHDFPSIGRRIFHLNARGIVTDASKPRLILLAFEDITTKVWADRKRKSRSQDLERSNADLEQFSIIASHDLQAPLNRISSFADLLVASANERLTDQERGYLEKLLAQTRRMRQLMQDLLLFAKVAERDLPFERVDLGEVMRDVLGELQPDIAGAAARIDIGELPIIKGRKFQLRQMFHNLIENSIKYRRTDVPLIVKVTGSVGPDGAVTLSFRDNGTGFKAEEANVIFEPFRRLPGHANEYKGTGMGLAICDRVMENHAGAISASGQPGEGAIFTATFPPANGGASS